MRIAPYLEPLVVPIDAVHPDPDNLRVHGEDNLVAIAESLREFGQVKPIVVDAQHTIRAGNGTWLAAKQILGARQIAAGQADYLTAEELDRYAIADNATQDTSAWDQPALIGRLRQLGPVPGITQADIDRLIASAESKEPPPPPTQGTPTGRDIQVQPGEMWILGSHRLLCGSATDKADVARVLAREQHQVCFTDPPYGVSYKSRDERHAEIRGDELRDDQLVQELLVPALRLAVAYGRPDAAYYVWHASDTRRDYEEALTAAALIEHQYIIWDKGTFVLGWGHYRYQHEPCFYCRAAAGEIPRWNGLRDQPTVWYVESREQEGPQTVSLAGGVRLTNGEGSELYCAPNAPKGRKSRVIRLADGEVIRIVTPDEQGDVWQVTRDRAADYRHPTQKPTALATKAILNHTRENEIVYDPFAGSGSTLMAAEVSGRRACVIEIEPNYCRDIIWAWERQTGREAKPAIER